MKRISLLICTAVLLFWTSATNAQKKLAPQSNSRCGTTRYLQLWQAQNADVVRTNARAIENLLKSSPSASQHNRLQATVTIPVVFHIVLPNPYIVTDADIQAQVDRLNLDFSGFNPDSTNVPAAFQAVRGHSQIRFVLAKRTPDGQPTNGIERRASSTTYDGSNNDPIKSTALGGLNAWDASQYLNIWVGGGGNLLGYATFPGTTDASQQGVVTDIIGTASNPCYVSPSYNLGRTLTHEIGHFLGLYHIWGDDTGCSSSDFRNLPGTCIISDPDLAGSNTDQTIGDTPNQGNENFGCPSGMVANSCGSPDGDMYQNFMDYTNDACMTMFTAKQVARMEWVIANCRPGYLTTQGGNPPVSGNGWDVAPAASVNPGGFEVNGCSVISYAGSLSCPGSITPKFRIINKGANTITSLTVGYSFNNGSPVTQTVAVNLPTGATYVVSFPSIAVGTGTHAFQFFTSSPNGNPDQNVTNDTLVETFRVMAPVSAPLTEGFENTPPFPHFTIENPNGDETWTRTTPGRNASQGKLTIDNYYNNTTGTIDDLKSAAIAVNPSKSYTLSFDVAHKYYSESGYHDTLSVLVSNDCGLTFTRVYQKWGPALAGSAGSSNDAYTTPAAEDWRTETIHLNGALIASGKLVFVIRNSGRFGNFIHLDNINLSEATGGDLQVMRVNSPASITCNTNVTPNVTVRNAGYETITAFNLGYSLNGGALYTHTISNISLAPNQEISVAMPTIPVSFSGSNHLRIYTFEPVTGSGTVDVNPGNDTISKTFHVPASTNAPLQESFLSATFPPTGWGVINPDGGLTWTRNETGNGNAGSAFLNTYHYSTLGQRDDLVTPIINYDDVDSVKLSFDLAAALYSASGNTGIPFDTLTVLVTRDCGNSYTTVYKKWGSELQTVNNSQTNEFFPSSARQWRKETIDLSQFSSKGALLVLFRVSNNSENNIFIDNVNFATQLLPSALKQKGYLILPTAFQNSFRIWHHQTPSSLKLVNVMNSAGQRVWSRQFSGNAERQLTIDLAGKASGVYLVEIVYADGNKRIVEKVVKY